MHSVIVPSHPPETSSQALRMCYFPVLLSFSHNCSTSLSVNSWRANAADLTHRSLIFRCIFRYDITELYEVSMFASLRLNVNVAVLTYQPCIFPCYYHFPITAQHLLVITYGVQMPLIWHTCHWYCDVYFTVSLNYIKCLHVYPFFQSVSACRICLSFLSKALFKAYLSIAAASCTMACWRVLTNVTSRQQASLSQVSYDWSSKIYSTMCMRSRLWPLP